MRNHIQSGRPRRRLLLPRGFTLIELLLVLVILGVLAGIVVPKLVGRGEQAKIKAAAIDISNISTALKMFETEVGRFPTSEEGLTALVENRGNLKGWNPNGYMEKLPVDPWGTEYQYRRPGQHNTNGFDLWSYGPDMNDGGGDDIDNWSQK